MSNKRRVLKAIAISTDEHEYRFLLKVSETDKYRSTLHIEEKFEDGWHGVPSGWYVKSLLDSMKTYPNNDRLTIDGGQNWYVLGFKKVMEEIKYILLIF